MVAGPAGYFGTTVLATSLDADARYDLGGWVIVLDMFCD